MTAKEYLEQAEYLDQHINALMAQIMSLRDLVTKTTSVLNDTPVTHTRDMHRSQEIIAKIVDLEKELDAEIDRLVDLKRDIMTSLSLIDNQEQRALLEMHYIQGMLWVNVGKALGYTPRHIRRLHQEALKKLTISKNMSANVPCGPGIDMV